MFRKIRDCSPNQENWLVAWSWSVRMQHHKRWIRMNLQYNCELWEYLVFHAISDLQHQHDQCKCWNVTKKEDTAFELALNIQYFTFHLVVITTRSLNLKTFYLKILSILWPLSRFFPRHKIIYNPRIYTANLNVNILLWRRYKAQIYPVKMRDAKWIWEFWNLLEIS